MIPEISYARTTDGADIAYTVLGDGPIEVVRIPAWLSHLESIFEGPFAQLQGRMLERIASFARVVTFDKRGTGMSSRTSNEAGAEVWVDDLHAVLDAVGMRTPVVWGDAAAGCAIAAMHAAAHPDRTGAVVLWAPRARTLWAPDYTIGWPEEDVQRDRESFLHGWGTEAWVRTEMEAWWGTSVSDPELIAHATKAFRSSATPSEAELLHRIWSEIDVRDVLPVIRAPTLVLTRKAWRDGDGVGPRSWQMSRFVAEQIPGARFVELSGRTFAPWLEDGEEVVAEVQEFLTGHRAPLESDRVLLTVLFTDVVDSTRRAAELGDRRWRELLAAHDARVRDRFSRFRGVEIDHAGDGFFATFDGPARAVRCALEIAEAVRPLGLEVRAGCHAGEVERTPSEVRGIAVHVGARVCSAAGASEVLVSSTVRDLTVGSDLVFEPVGDWELKGVPGSWPLFRARLLDPADGR